MRLKPGVLPKGMQPEIMLAVIISMEVYYEFGYDFVITSITDGKHGDNSLHYTGQAIDVRTRHLGTTSKPKIAREIASRLGDSFDVVLEKTHIHIEHDPKE